MGLPESPSGESDSSSPHGPAERWPGVLGVYWDDMGMSGHQRGKIGGGEGAGEDSYFESMALRLPSPPSHSCQAAWCGIPSTHSCFVWNAHAERKTGVGVLWQVGSGLDLSSGPLAIWLRCYRCCDPWRRRLLFPIPFRARQVALPLGSCAELTEAKAATVQGSFTLGGSGKIRDGFLSVW